MNLHDTLADIHALETELLNFERKYGIRSETLYAAYIEGEEPEDDAWVLDFGEWASIYRTWLSRQAEYRNQIQRIRQSASGLAGLIKVSHEQYSQPHPNDSALQSSYPHHKHTGVRTYGIQ